MIIRTTIWQDSGGEDLQVSVARLTDWYDPEEEITLPCGPFHPAAEQAREALRRLGGVQMSLWGPDAPGASLL